MDLCDELDAKYNKLMATLYGHGSIMDLVRMEVLVSTINGVLSKIGPFYDIPRIPQNCISLRREEEEQFIVSGFFYINGKHRYVLLHVIAIPQTIGAGWYLIPRVDIPTMNGDFNQ